MTVGWYRSLFTAVSHYLLFATIALLGLDLVVDIGSRVPFFALSLVVAAAFALLPLWRYLDPTGAEESDSRMDATPAIEPRVDFLILTGLVVVGTILRGYALGVQSFWVDEAITANAAIALLEHGQPTFRSGYTYWRAFPHTLFVAGSMAVFGTGEVAARLPSVVFGAATIVVTYWLGREVGGRNIGLLAAVLVTFASWEIAWSRQARMYQQFQLLYVLSLVLLLRVERKWFGDRRVVGGLVVVGVLAALTHQIGYVLLPVGVTYLAIVGYLDGRLTRRTATWLAGGSLAVLLVVEFVGTGISGVLETVAATNVDYWEAYVGWLAGEFHAFFYLGLIGSGVAFHRGWYRPDVLLLLAIVPATWVLSYHTQLFATRYLYFGLPLLLVWSAMTIEFVGGMAIERAQAVHRQVWETNNPPKRINADWTTYLPFIATFGLVASLAIGGGFTVAPQAEYELGVNAPQPDFKSAYQFVNKHRKPGDVIVAGWTAPGQYYAGEVNYWLVHDLTGSGEDQTVNNRDRYAGAEPIRDSERLKAVIEGHDRGWIVVDEIAFYRWTSSASDPGALATEVNVNETTVRVFYWGQRSTEQSVEAESRRTEDRRNASC